MNKQQTIEHWQGLEAGLPILKHMQPIPYKASGSTYGACGIRIDGNPAFIDAVMSRLKDLLAGEGIDTRLGLARNTVTPTLKINGQTKHFGNTANEAEVCYIRLHTRGDEGAHMQAIVAGASMRQLARKQLAAAGLD